ncbi:Retrovirus-related Pol polyprotein from transposon opus [Trichinella sp. T6]|nr:Retrovirus-related Pol polyprotein from transposon opus [Trichinella sp. T6]
MNRAPDGATIGERGRISENPRWIMPPEALTQSSDVERWFIRMERYFRAADVPDNRRAAMVQYHMDEAMGDVLSALEVEETDDYDKLKSTLFRVFGAFPQLKDQADGILLQQFEAGIRQDMIKFTILRSAPDSFEKAVKIVAREDLMINHVTAATASASVVTTTADGKKETARMKAKHATALRVGHVANWGTLALTAIHTLEANMVETIHNLGRVPKPSIRLEAAIGGELAVTNAYVMEIVLGGTLHPGPGRKLLANTTLLHPVPKVHCGGPCGAKSANSRSQILVAMEQMLPKEQEAGGKYRRTVSAILEQFSDVLATSDEDLGWTRTHRILSAGTVGTLLNGMIHRDVIEQSAIMQSMGVPNSDYALSGAQWYSTLDHASGYWHVEMETRDRENTAFTTPYGLYQFKVMPFGLCNAPATFQRLMETSLRGLVGSKCFVYLHDVSETFCRTVQEHTARMQEELDHLRKVGLKVKHKKSQLMKWKVAHLGHIISEKGIANDPSKTRAVKEWQALSCVSELRQFLGLASYYRMFASIAAPLSGYWKETRSGTPILAYPVFRCRFLVDVDASGDGLGAVLSQKDGSKERFVAYASRSLTKPECRYCVTRREMLRLVWALREF